MQPSGSGPCFGGSAGGGHAAHAGGMPEATALMVLFPATNIAVVVLANTSTRPAAMMQEFTIAQQAAAAAVPDRAPARLGPPFPPGPPTLVVSPELAGESLGTLRTYEGAVPKRLLNNIDRTIQPWLR